MLAVTREGLPNMKSPNLPQAARFVKRNNRPGWEA